MRAYWKGDEGKLGDLATRLAASPDLFNKRGRKPWASVNFIAAHDGFTLNDLVSYNDKHNEANGEENRDGHSHNLSLNHGVEGPTEDPEIRALRERHKRNMLATLLLSQGTPMILAGDEFGRTQQGNNNTYCQDNELNWVGWAGIDGAGRELAAFTRKLIALRQNFPVLRSAKVAHRHTGVEGVLDSTPDMDYTLEFFATPRGTSGATRFLDDKRISTGASGRIRFKDSLPKLGHGMVVSATATSLNGETSELSPRVRVR